MFSRNWVMVHWSWFKV